jgi:Ca2+-binding EF-hand superfamily protein
VPKAFQEYDRDGDGVIDEAEIGESMRDIVMVMCMESALTEPECSPKETSPPQSKNQL